jgi:hypothetical protein
VRAAVALLVVLGFVACVSAKSYGAGGYMKGGYGANYVAYRPQPMYYAIQQPTYYGVGVQGGGSGSGNILGGSGNMFGGGYGGGSNTGSIIPIIIICKYIHRMKYR